jgi:integrase
LAKHGERDYALLSILYDTGARIQELLDLSPRDFHLDSPPFVCVHLLLLSRTQTPTPGQYYCVSDGNRVYQGGHQARPMFHSACSY